MPANPEPRRAAAFPPRPSARHIAALLPAAAMLACILFFGAADADAAQPPGSTRAASASRSGHARTPKAGLLRRLLTRRCAPRCCRSAPSAASTAAARPAEPKWTSLFDGKTLDGWKITPFGGEGEVKVENGDIVLNMGASLTGITYDGKMPLPKTNYEISLDAMRADGIDFFCGLTFPVADSFCSFIVGGWAGSVVGLSSIDGRDASENDTTRFMKFETGKWYRMRVRVTPDRIQCWIDDEQVVDQDIRGKRIGLRNEVDPNKPLGLSSFETKARLRNIRIRRLPAAAND